MILVSLKYGVDGELDMTRYAYQIMLWDLMSRKKFKEQFSDNIFFWKTINLEKKYKIDTKK